MQDPQVKEHFEGPELWKRIAQFVHALPRHRAHSLITAAQSTREKENAMVGTLLNDAPLPLLFAATTSAFASGDEIHSKLAAEALTCVFGSATGAKLCLEQPDILTIMQAGLQHDSPGLRRLTIDVVRAAAAEEPTDCASRCRVLLATPLLPLLVQCVSDDAIATAQAAADTIVDMLRFAANDEGVATSDLLAPADLEALGAAADAVVSEVASAAAAPKNSTVELRLAELAARCASLSDVTFEKALQRRTLAPLLRLAYDSDDLILRLNALELMELLAAVPAGATFLFREGHVATLLSLAGAGDSSSSDSSGGGGDTLLGGSALRVLGAIYRRASGISAAAWADVEPTLARAFLRVVVTHFGARDESAQLAALAAIASFAGSGRAALAAALQDEELLSAWLSFSQFKVEVRAVALHSVAAVLGPPPPPSNKGGGAAGVVDASAAANGNAAGEEALSDADGAMEVDVNAAEERSALCNRLVEQIGVRNGRPAGDYLLQQARLPVPEVRYAAYDVMRCMAHQRGGWGLRSLFGAPGFRDFIVERGAEREHRGMEWRFSVVESIAKCPDRSSILSSETISEMESMLREGPFRSAARPPEVQTV